MKYKQQKQLSLTALVVDNQFPKWRLVFDPATYEGKVGVNAWWEVLDEKGDFWERAYSTPYRFISSVNYWCTKEALGKREQVPRKYKNKWVEV